MPQKMHTVWVTILTLVAIMLSNVVNSAPLMPLQMLADTQMSMPATSADSHCASSSHKSVDSKPQECCDNASLTSEHQCCYGSCVGNYSYSVIATPVYPLSQTSALVLFSKDPISRVSSIASALFRPPIA